MALPEPISPGVCICLAPGIPLETPISYSIRQHSILAAIEQQNRGERRGRMTVGSDRIFRDARGNKIGGGGSLIQQHQGPAAKMQFFFERSLSDMMTAGSGGTIQGMSTDASGSLESRHHNRNGTGRFWFVSQSLVDMIANALKVGNPLPVQGAVSDFTEALGQIPNLGLDTWLTNLLAVGRGSGGHAFFGYLVFPDPRTTRGRRGLT